MSARRASFRCAECGLLRSDRKNDGRNDKHQPICAACIKKMEYAEYKKQPEADHVGFDPITEEEKTW